MPEHCEHVRAFVRVCVRAQCALDLARDYLSFLYVAHATHYIVDVVVGNVLHSTGPS